jgi:hypothetical protein
MSGPRLLTGLGHAAACKADGCPRASFSDGAFKKPPTATVRSSQLKPRDYTLLIQSYAHLAGARRSTWEMLTRSGHHHPEETRWFMIGISCCVECRVPCGSRPSANDRRRQHRGDAGGRVLLHADRCAIRLALMPIPTVGDKLFVGSKVSTYSRCPLHLPTISHTCIIL